MPEGESLPKTGKSKDWLAHADAKRKEFKDYHDQKNIFGQPKNAPPLQDDYSRLLSQSEVEARKMGMQLLRDEKRDESAMKSYRKGGRVEESGPEKLHSGEAIARKKTRKKSRSCAR